MDGERPLSDAGRARAAADDGRGTNPSGGPDAHADNRHAGLPPFDADYTMSDTNDRIDRVLSDDPPRSRTQTLFPYLYVRSVPGDQGARPLYPPTTCWESCDIHLVPANSGPFSLSNTVLQPVVGQSYRVVVHVWNLGRFAAYGARLKAWWIDPGFFAANDPQYGRHFIGGTYFDLGDRDSANAHQLIEVPTPWTVVMNNDGHECLMVSVECATDPWDGVLDSNWRRHVAQRNVNLVAGGQDLTALVSRLGAAFSGRQTELRIDHASVGRADFTVAQGHGLARAADAGGGWNQSGLALGRESLPLAGVQRGRDGLRFVDRRPPVRPAPDRGPVPIRPPLPPGPGAPVRELGRELPRLLQQLLRTPDFTARSIAVALGGRDQARILRFTARDAEGRVGGYSIVVAP